jgi:hypothetical protein
MPHPRYRETYMKLKVVALLTDEQKAKLPKKATHANSEKKGKAKKDAAQCFVL